jgi:hypothetical protein
MTTNKPTFDSSFWTPKGRDRFSKTTLAQALFAKIHLLEMEYNFDRGNGFSQVVGHPEDVNRAYGEFRMALDVVERFDLPEPPTPPGWTPFNRQIQPRAGMPRKPGRS